MLAIASTVCAAAPTLCNALHHFQHVEAVAVERVVRDGDDLLELAIARKIDGRVSPQSRQAAAGHQRDVAFPATFIDPEGSTC